MKKDYTKVLLGYRDYNNDEMYGKDFPTIDSISDWIVQVIIRDAEITSGFVDFILQEYSIQELFEGVKKHIKENWQSKGTEYDFESEVMDIIEGRRGGCGIVMHASDFKDAEIPQS